MKADVPWMHRRDADDYEREHHRRLWSGHDVRELLYRRYPFSVGAGMEFYDKLGAIEVGGNNNTAYYEWRAVAKLVRSMFPRRVYCKWCGKECRWGSDSKWWRSYQRCSEECQDKHVNDFWRREQERQKEQAWIRQGKTRLREIRHYLRDQRQGVSPSPTAASRPEATSPA